MVIANTCPDEIMGESVASKFVPTKRICGTEVGADAFSEMADGTVSDIQVARVLGSELTS